MAMRMAARKALPGSAATMAAISSRVGMSTPTAMLCCCGGFRPWLYAPPPLVSSLYRVAGSVLAFLRFGQQRAQRG